MGCAVCACGAGFGAEHCVAGMMRCVDAPLARSTPLCVFLFKLKLPSAGSLALVCRLRAAPGKCVPCQSSGADGDAMCCAVFISTLTTVPLVQNCTP
ncbi:hypothetical protein BS50DRAFT_100600 [Corynespora cassiicola Philippines]|uniref:Uncharacterized protein n=1 Tax=Corynespora cassiicola Philippines TaxID=1448308 RepID=A0A2T2NBU8_CORCC|nr:hypothetical protein BS50DRAFT_100600 [Corynespora cassiicola Philippines]